MNKIFPKHFLLLIDKAPGRTSHDEVVRIRRALKGIGVDAKVGHSGTLDPKVTGLLVVGVGKATKLLSMLLESPKTYVGTLEIHKPIKREMLEHTVEHFKGKIEQLPPQKSSVKRVLRTRYVYGLEIQRFSPREAVLNCVVERGTYIRKLFHDMGEYMDTGASMGPLRRTGVAEFSIDDPRVISSDQFVDLINIYISSNILKRRSLKKRLAEIIVPTEEIVKGYKRVQLEKGMTRFISSGADVFVPGVFSVEDGVNKGEDIALFDGLLLVGLGIARMNTYQMRTEEKGIAIEITKRLC